MAPSQRTRRGLVGLGTALSVVAAAATGTASAEPLFNPTPPNSSNPVPGSANPAPPTADMGVGAIIDPPSESGWRPNPFADAPGVYVPQPYQPYSPPTTIGPFVLPPPPPMIMPEPGMIRVGRYQEVKPPWVTMAEMNSINRWAAYIESRVAQFWLSQGFSAEEADQRAASMMVGGLAGGAAGAAAGFAVGILPGALVGAGVGAVGGLAAGAAIAAGLGLPLNALFPVVGTGLYGSFIGIGALAGAGAGAVTGALAGGLIGGLLVGIPGAAAGVALGSLFGGGDPNAPIDQIWTYRDGSGQIVPKENALEFDWQASNMLPPGVVLPNEAHINFQVKTDGTLVVKLGEERWIGATVEQRDEHFYGEIDKALPGAGEVVKGFLEEENGAFQTAVRGVLGQIAAGDPATAQYNPSGDIADPSARESRVPYPTTSTPDPWDEPNREGVEEQLERNRGSNFPQPVPAVANVTPTAASNVALPQPIQDVVSSAPEPVQQMVNDAHRALGELIPGILGA